MEMLQRTEAIGRMDKLSSCARWDQSHEKKAEISSAF